MRPTRILGRDLEVLPRWLAGGLLVGVVLVLTGQALRQPPLAPGASASPPTSAASTTTPQPPVEQPSPVAPAAALAWSQHLFPERHALLDDIEAMGDRLVVVGALDGEPAAWYSDDDAETWARSTFNYRSMPRSRDTAEPLYGIVAQGDTVLGLAWVSGPYHVRTQVWISQDAGATWTWARPPTDQIENITATAAGFTAIGYDHVSRRDSTRGFWTSPDGLTWHRVPAPVPNELPVSGHAELAGMRVHPVPYVDNGAPEDLRPPTVWTVPDGRPGRAVEVERRPGRVYGVEATPAGFIAAGYTGPVWERHRAMVWISPDGEHWSRMRIDSELGSVAGGIATNGLGTIVTGWFYVPQWAMGPVGQYVWFSAGSSGPFKLLEPGIQLHGLEALADEFVGVGDCRGSDECVPAVVFGRRGGAAPTPSPSPKQIPVPTQTSIAGGTPRPCAPETIAGRLTFTGDRRFALAGDDGTLLSVIWPDGWYAQRTVHGVGLFTLDRSLVALDGDLVRLGGELNSRGALLSCRKVEVTDR